MMGGALFSALLTPIQLHRRRQSGGIDRSAQITAAVRTGNLPGLIEPHSWMAELARRRRALAGTRSLYVVGPVCVLLSVGGSLLADGAVPWGVWLVVAIVITVVATSLVSARRTVPRIEALEAKISAAYGLESDRPPEGVSSPA
jgi:hypothetical protein